MLLRKFNFSLLTYKLTPRLYASLKNCNDSVEVQETNKISTYMGRKNIKYSFSLTGSRRPPQTKITYEIQKANSTQQLRSILQNYGGAINFIHRTVMLQKVTQRPFDQDEELINQVISEIKKNWRSDFPEPTDSNSRAIANTICYMCRKKKFHHLDDEFTSINYFQLAQNLNPKEFVMTLNGLLKLQLVQKVQLNTKNQFSLQKFITQNVNEKFPPSLIVSMWFNVLKFQKSSQNINNFFASLIKNKHFKNNLIDYMQIVYCYVNSEGSRTVDLTYPVMTHPKQLPERNYMGAHELSVLYQQLAKLKKIKDIYFSEEFNEVLEKCYLNILIERDIPLRNVANVFNYLVMYENPTSKMLQTTFHKYFTVLRAQINLLERSQGNRRIRTNVDSLSFVTLFNQLLEYYHAENNFLNEMVSISFSYLQKIIANQHIFNEYNERTFMRLISGIELSKKMIQQKYPGKKFQLSDQTKLGLQKEIIRRQFNEVQNLSKLMNFVSHFEIRHKDICHKFKKMAQMIPKQNEAYQLFQQRFKQKCILNKSCINCINCFSN